MAQFKQEYFISQSISGSFFKDDVASISFKARKGGNPVDGLTFINFCDLWACESSTSFQSSGFEGATNTNLLHEQFSLPVSKGSISGSYGEKSFVAKITPAAKYEVLTVLISGSVLQDSTAIQTSGSKTDLLIDYDDFEITIEQPKVELVPQGFLAYTTPKRYVKIGTDGEVTIKGGEIEAQKIVAGELEVYGDVSLFGDIQAGGGSDPYNDTPENIASGEGTSLANDGSSTQFARGDHVHALPFATLAEVVDNGLFSSISGSVATLGNATMNNTVTKILAPGGAPETTALEVTGTLDVSGDLIARNFITINETTINTTLSDGSTVFGNTGDDIHHHTGSIHQSGSDNNAFIGKVWIGSSTGSMSATQFLTVAGDISASGDLYVDDDIILNNNSTLGFTDALNLQFNNDNDTDDGMVINMVGTPLHYFTEGGKFGMGMIPSYPLDITGSIDTNNNGVARFESNGGGDLIFNDNANGGGETAIKWGGNGRISGEGSQFNLQALNKDFRFFTDSSLLSGEVMRIKQDGKVGIGEDTPASLLHIKGATNRFLEFQRSTTDDEAHVYFDLKGNDADPSLFKIHLSGSNADFSISGSTKELLFVSSSGRVGMGTTNPYKNLDVRFYSDSATLTSGLGGVNGNGILIENTRNAAGRFANLDFRVNNADARIALEYDDANDGGLHFITDNDNSPGTRMYIASAGNVGIGTTTPSDTLTVAGIISSSADIYADEFRTTKDFITSTSAKGVRSEGEYVSLTSTRGFHYNKYGTGNLLSLDSTNSKMNVGTDANNIKLIVAGVISGSDKIHMKSNKAIEWGGGTNKASIREEAYHLKYTTGVGGDHIFRSGSNTLMIITDEAEVGIGTANPSVPLHVSTVTDHVAKFYSSDNKAMISVQDHDTVGLISAENGALALGGEAGTHARNLNIQTSSGVIGHGTNTFKAWDDMYAVTQIGGRASILSYTASDSRFVLSDNVYTNDGGVWKRINAGYASQMFMEDGAVYFRTAGTDTSDSTATLLNQLTIANDGNIGIGPQVTNPNNLLHLTSSTDTYIEVETSNADRDAGIKFNTMRDNATMGASYLYKSESMMHFDMDSGIHYAHNGRRTVSFNNNEFTIVSSSTTNKQGVGETFYKADIVNKRIGIGTTSPAHKLEVKGPVSTLARFYSEDNGSQGQIEIGTMDIYVDNDVMKLRSAADAEWLTLSGSRVGIGTNTPSYKFEVKNTAANAELGITGGTTDARLVLTSNESTWLVQNDYSNAGALSFYNGTGGHTLVIEEAGHVGIGTTTPTNLLHLYEQGNSNAQLYIYATGSSGNENAAGIKLFADNDYTQEAFIKIDDNGLQIGTTANEDIIFKPDDTEILRLQETQDDNGDVFFHGTSTPSLYISGSTKDIGIGTTNPSAHLHIKTQGGTNPNIFVTGTNSGHIFDAKINNDQRFRIDNSGNINFSVSSTTAKVWNMGTGGVSISSNSQNKDLFVASSGKVGVGTTTPTEALHVSGTIAVYSGSVGKHPGNGAFTASGDNWQEVLKLGNTNQNGFSVAVEDGGTSQYSLYTNRWGAKYHWWRGSEDKDGLGNITHPIAKLEGNDDYQYFKLYDGLTNTVKVHLAATGSQNTYFNYGNVGIGTTTPDELLTVRGFEKNAIIHISADEDPNADNYNAILKFSDGDDVAGQHFKIEFDTSTEDLTFKSNTNNDILHLDTLGDVGIGTTDPKEKLHVTGDGIFTGKRIYWSHDGDTDTNNDFMRFSDSSWNGARGVVSLHADQARSAGTGSGKAALFCKGIYSTGNVGIGTDSPSSELEVAGAITANSVGITGTGTNYLEIKSTDEHAELKIDAFTNNDARIKLLENGTLKWNLYNDGDDSDAFKIADTDETLVKVEQSGDVWIKNNLDVDGDIKARTYITETTTVNNILITQSGSTNFGDTLDDIHSMTGSLKLTGSIETDGKVGIGKTSPTQPLEVVGSISGSNNLHLGGNVLYSNGDPTNHIFKFMSYGSSGLKLQTAALIVSGNYNNGKNAFDSMAGAGQESAYFGGDVAIGIHDNGKLGVGIANPEALLHLHETGSNQYQLILESTGSGGTGINIIDSSTHGTSAFWYAKNNNVYFGATDNEELRFQTGNTTRMTILNSSGNVGLNTTTPKTLLDIKNEATYSLEHSSSDFASDSIGLYGAVAGADTAYFGGISWHNGGRRRAGISSVMEAADSDFVGISFFTQGTDGDGPMAESMRLSRDGYLGIGTKTPKALLTVGSSTNYVNPSGDASEAVFYGTGGNGGISILSELSNGESNILFGYDSSAHTSDGQIKYANNSTGTSQAMYFKVNSATALQLDGNQVANFYKHINLKAQSATEGGEIRFEQGTNGTYENWVIDSYQNRIRFIYGSTELMTGNTTGNVGIGTTAPVAKLQVNGELGIHDGSGTVHTQLYRDTDTGGVTFKRVNNSDGSDNGGDFLVAGYGELKVIGEISASNHLRTNGNIYLDNHADNSKGMLLFKPDGGTHNHKSGSIRKNSGGGLRIANNKSIVMDLFDPVVGSSSFLVYDSSGYKQFGVNTAGNVHIPSGSMTINGNIDPIGDNQHDLGTPTARWQDLYAVKTTTGGIYEAGLETKGLKDLPIGTLVVWEDGKCVPCNKYADELVMGVAGEKDEPIILGAEPILVTGDVKIGEYIITSNVEGHGESIDSEYLLQRNLYGKVIGQALESAKGDSSLIKCMIRKM